jgi:acyl-coenzyme A synthetase/AMP-(fatty) acid ligase
MFKEVGISAEEGRRQIVVIGQDLGWAKSSGSGTGKLSSTGLIQWEELLSLGSLPREETFDGDGVNETAMMCYSSGTTGKPKGVEARVFRTPVKRVWLMFPILTRPLTRISLR